MAGLHTFFQVGDSLSFVFKIRHAFLADTRRVNFRHGLYGLLFW